MRNDALSRKQVGFQTSRLITLHKHNVGSSIEIVNQTETEHYLRDFNRGGGGLQDAV